MANRFGRCKQSSGQPVKSDVIDVFPSRDGGLTVSVDSLQLYSKYNPSLQVRRFLETKNLQNTGCIIIISDGLGLIEEEIIRLDTDATLISIVLSRYVYSYQPRSLANAAWIYDPDERSDHPSLKAFLRNHLGRTNTATPQLLVWDPAARAFENEYTSTFPHIETFLRREAHSQLTTRAFGRKWIRNITRNLTSPPSPYRINTLPETGKPVVVIIPGPSTDECCEIVSRYRTRVIILTVSSALSVLKSWSIVPDIVVHTDPGYYARLHFSPGYTPGKAILCMPLTAAGPRIPFHAWFAFSNGLNVEQDALRYVNAPEIRIPEAGTVTATALRIAGRISTYRTFVCGLDLCLRDIQSHARGHSFSSWILPRTSRFSSVEQAYLERAVHADGDGSGYRYAPNLDVYASWIRDYARDTRDLYRVAPSPVDAGMNNLSLSAFDALLSRTPDAEDDLAYAAQIDPLPFLPPDDAGLSVARRWNRLRQQSSSGSDLTNELRTLLGDTETL
ncbi:MAG: DUF115 domain-containing protein [Spirochaetaceae bacterium]|nr:MAG: DUF115 domain-containing protein [Spirochaetaceae bacterium]